MSILYVFTISCPNNVEPFPPSVYQSEWFQGWYNYLVNHGVSSTLVFQVIFENETALNTYINTYKCTDASLLADISTWKNAHSITYSSAYYTLSDANISPVPDPIVS